jgi:pyrimidine operon attenuation protein/uracil phosphoribosyltransferase
MVIVQLPDAEALLAVLIGRLREEVTPDTGLVGIHTGGVWIAERLHATLGGGIPLGRLDPAFYRDDFKQRGLKPRVKTSSIPFDTTGRDIILVDDVLYTGRTVRAAMNVLFDYGRPGRVRLAALLDRGGRQLPICAQFLGGTFELPADAPMIQLQEMPDGKLKLAMEATSHGG